MKDYASMSDFEINKAVFVKTQYYDDVIDKPVRDGTAVHWGDGCNWREFDPCNNPADAWPVITTNRIVVIPAPEHGEWWSAHRVIGEDRNLRHFTQHGNPLRAAMIVFLKMMEGEK